VVTNFVSGGSENFSGTFSLFTAVAAVTVADVDELDFFVLCDDAFELFDVDEEEESLDDELLLELLERDDCVLPGASLDFEGPSMSSSSDFMQPLMSVLMSKSLLDPSPSSWVSIFNFLLNFN
jgi:hypothetical protein